ncbi:MAG: GNAT family N-acetyltransferase [Bacteroidales bacterium]|nr:GNAT family N-acetyltransferase [Bacteroidales bacterium]
MIRKSTVNDVPKLREMAEIAFRDTYRTILSPEQMEYMMDWMYSEESLEAQILDKGHIYYIVEGKGYVSIRPDGELPDGRPLFHLEKIYVLPDFKGQGLGRMFFSTAVEEARRLAGGRPFRIELNVNRSNPAVGFYEHLGMSRAREGDFPIGGGFYMNDYIYAIEID